MSEIKQEQARCGHSALEPKDDGGWRCVWCHQPWSEMTLEQKVSGTGISDADFTQALAIVKKQYASAINELAKDDQ